MEKRWTAECVGKPDFHSPFFITKQACLAWIAQQKDPSRFFPKKWVG